LSMPMLPATSNSRNDSGVRSDAHASVGAVGAR
jgi:hypothetical protein